MKYYARGAYNKLYNNIFTYSEINDFVAKNYYS